MVLRFWNRSMFEDIRGFEQTLHYRINERARELGVKADIGRR